MVMNSPRHLTVGRKGEDIAAQYLEERGYRILARNYLKAWGEIDIIGEREGILHFVEVKTVSRETGKDGEIPSSSFTPEDNVHFKKRQRLARVISTYLLEAKVPQETPFQVDLISVYLDPAGDRYAVDFLEDILLS